MKNKPDQPQLMLSQRYHNNIRSDFVTFLRWTGSPKANLLPQDYFSTKELERLEEQDCLKETISASDLAKLFATACDRQHESCLGLGKDGGVRNFEIPRVKKKFVCPDEMLIKLPGFDSDGTRITKTGKERWIPMSKVLWGRLKWMFDEHREDDFRISRVLDWSGKLHEIAQAAEVLLPDNALRHGYGTHRLKLTNDVKLVSREMGNTPYILMKHYSRDVRLAESLEWFAV